MLIKKICEMWTCSKNNTSVEKFEVSDGDDVNNLIFILCRKKGEFFLNTRKVEFLTFPHKGQQQCEVWVWNVLALPFTPQHGKSTVVSSSVAEHFFPSRPRHNILWLNFVNHDRARIETKNFICVQWAEIQSPSRTWTLESGRRNDREDAEVELNTRDFNYCFIIISSCSVNHS